MYCRRTFHELDVDGSGTLSLAELHTLLGGGASAAAAFAALDTMHTEEVSYTEYLAAVVAGQERSCRPHDNACIKAHALHAHCTCTCTCTAHALLAHCTCTLHIAHAQEHTAHAQERFHDDGYIKSAFDRIDADGSGEISLEEIAQVLGRAWQ